MNKNEIFGFLRSLYLFSDLKDDALMDAVELFDEKTYLQGEVLFSEGDSGDYFHIVVSGTIDLSRKEGYIGTIGRKEYLGEGALLHGTKRSATATAATGTLSLILDKESFDDLLEKNPQVENLLTLFAKSYDIARRKAFPWLGKDEVIRLIDQKHWAVLFGKLLAPVTLVILDVIFVIFLIRNESSLVISIAIASIFSFILFLWILWIWVDWGNDYYIVTDKRVVWLEKVIWFYDQRRESPLQTILSVNSSSNQLQRIIGYANVIVRTYTGQITMRNAAHPQELEGMIKAYWHLAEERMEEEKAAKITQTIRSRLGFEEEQPENDIPEEEVIEGEGAPPDSKPATILSPKLGNLFKTRYEFEGVITYRKHIYILLKQVWVHILIYTILFLANLFSALLLDFEFTKILLSATGIYVLISSFFWGYKLLDWANDRFQLTDTEIVDLDKKPLGKETRRSAPLESILSLDYTRENILQRTLNFGTVVINVGNARFDFEMVVNPSIVQQEIFEHYYAALRRKEDEEAQRRREDMVEFLAVYHEENERYQDAQASAADALEKDES